MRPNANAERRTAPRARVGREVSVIVKQRCFDANLVDLSCGGALIEVDNERKIGLTVGISLTVANRTMTLPARVFRSTVEGKAYKLGCRFDGLTRVEREHLKTYLRVYGDPATPPSDSTQPVENLSAVLCSVVLSGPQGL